MISRANINGLSLIELIVVVAIVAILGVVAIPRWEVQGLGLEFEARRILNDIRYTQALSMASGQRYRWVKLSANAYSIYNEAGAAIVMPSGSGIVTLSNDVQIGSLANLPGNLLSFSSLGVPYATSGLSGAPLSAVASISLNSGTETRTIQVSPDTGYAELS